MKIDLNNPRHNQLAVWLVVTYYAQGDIKDIFELFDEDDVDITKILKEDFGCQSYRDVENFLRMNSEFIHDDLSLLVMQERGSGKKDYWECHASDGQTDSYCVVWASSEKEALEIADYGCGATPATKAELKLHHELSERDFKTIRKEGILDFGSSM